MNRGWLELESDPGLFTLLVENFGVKGVQVEEVYDLQKPIEGPVYGFIFLFKWIEERRSRRKVQPLTDETFVDDESVVNDMFFAQQLIPNSCATHALLSILLNCPSIALGSTLTKLKNFTKNFSPENKGYAIGSLAELARAHNSHAKPEPRHIQEKQMGISTVRTMETFHFVSYVPINGRLFELDGLKPYPIDHGPWGEQEEWTDKFRRVIRERLDMGGCDIRFNLMAVVADRRQGYEQKLKILKSNEHILMEALQQLVKYTKPSLPLVQKPPVATREPVVTRSKFQATAKVSRPVKKEREFIPKVRNGANKFGNNKTNSKIISSYRPPPALDTHNYAKSPLSEHDETSTEDSTLSDEENEEVEEDEDDSETDTDEEVEDNQQLSEIQPPAPQFNQHASVQLTTAEIARHLRLSQMASETLIQVSVDVASAEPGLLKEDFSNLDYFLSRGHLLPEIKLIPNSGSSSSWSPLTVQTVFANKCSSLPSPSGESTDTASEAGSAFNSPARSTSSGPNSPSQIVAQFREWKTLLSAETDESGWNKELEVSSQEVVEVPEEKEQETEQVVESLTETIENKDNVSKNTEETESSVDVEDNKPSAQVADTAPSQQSDCPNRQLVFEDGPTDMFSLSTIPEMDETESKDNEDSVEDMDCESEEQSPNCQRTFHPKDVVVLLKNLQSEIQVCEQRLCDETEKRKKYHVDDCRRTHNYDPFISTFLSILAEQDLLAGLVDQHMVIRRRQGYSLGRLLKTSKPDKRRRSRPSLLFQFFCDRIQQLVQCKHMHMLRWKRFCSHTSTLEAVYPMYQKRLALIMSEYNDAIARARRLAVAKDDLYSSKQAIAAGLVTMADIQIYTRWLTCHLHSIKKIHSYLKVLEWVSVSHKHEIVPTPTSQITEEVSKAEVPDSSRSAYTARSEHRKSSLGDAFFRRTSVASRPGSAASGPTAPLSASVNLISTHTVPANVSGSVLAVSGGGLVSNEATQGIPTHVTDLESLKPVLEFLMACYGIQMDINQISTSANEMELVANVNRKFRAAFAKQEQQRTFPTYDKIELGMETWGADSPAQALKKESNWLPFIKVKPEADPHQVKMLTNLRQRGNIDELLKAQSRFLTVTDSSKVQDALKDHAVAVRDPPVAQPISVTSYRSSSNTNAIWRKIYLNSNLYSGTTKEEDMTIVEFDEKDVDSVNYSGRLGSAGGRKRRDSDEYNYFNAMQMLGLDDDDEGHQDPTMIQGGYLSFLNLRHLRIRDLQRTCLSILNYFRSVERTLTINDGGLSLENGHQKKTSQNHRVGVREGGQDGGGGLGSHHYLHYTPADYKISEAEFMEFSEVENHDDFYTLEDGRVHVQDQRGYYIIYDAAMKDLENLEKDLLLIATHFIEKDKDHRSVGSASTRRSDSARKRQSQAAGDVDMPVYGHQQVDRFAVLMDLWTSEADYLENKRQLLDCYLEAYHNVFDMQEKRQLAQVITNTMYQRPRFDFDASYFVKTYRAECICLRLHSSLIKSILDKQIAEQREYIQKMTREGDSDFGLPHEIVPKQLVALNLSRPALKHVYMLEFHPSLAMGSRLPVCLKRAYFDLVHTHQPRSVTEAVSMEKKLLEVALSQWEKLDRPGNSYSSQVQKDVFQDVFAEDPLFICEIGSSLFKTKDMAAGKRSKKEKQADLLAIWTRLLETITIRHRLIDAAWETEILSKLYKKHAFEMGFDEYHLFLRYVQFEFASFKDKADQPPPVFITALLEDDSSVDRYVPSTLLFAIQEIDEKHVGMFTFRNRDGFVKMIEGSGLENLRIALQCQVVHKNALLSAVQQASVCSYFQEVSPAVDNGMSGRKSPSDARSEKSSMTALTTTGPQTTNIQSMASSVVFASKLKTGMERQKRSPESFVSLQLEKVPSRDIILNEFLKKKQSMGTLMKSIEEVEKLKRSLIDKFCHHYQRRMSQYSLRGQIIAYLNSTMALLEEFPTTKQTHFIIGRPGEKKTEEDDKKGLLTDPRILHKRPRRILSQDGSMLLNLWFLPHHSEVLIMFKTLDNDTCIRALRLTLQLVAALHDILHYLCSYSRLGSSNARLGSKRMETADWGGTEGISAELRGIQKQIDNLDNPTNPQEVADFLTLRRDVMFLEFDTSVRHAMCDTFLSTNNVSAFRSITDNMHTALTSLSNAQVPSVYAISMPIPEPFEARDFPAQQLTPWRAFISRRGPFPTQFWDFRQIEYNMQLCLAGLRDVDRHVANGEILGVSLQMEDVLQTCQPDELYTNMDVESDDENGEKGTAKGGTTPRAEEQQPVEEKEKEVSHQPATKKPISRSKEPIKAYGLLKKFLILWKILEVFKKEWARRKIQDEDVSTASAFRKYCKVYKTEILYPVVKSIARKYGQGEIYEGMIREDEPVPAPKGASEMEIRAKQLIRLLDHLEAFMILELRKKIAKEHTLVVSERGREEGNLPTDLWKKPVINERMTIAKPHIAEDFSRMLMSEATQSGDDIIIKREALNKSLSMLANLVMQRERSNYESYSMYYENLLRHHHQLLYQREQEIKKLQDTSKDTGASGLVEVQCQLADRSHELILEITALRAKIAEMRELALTMETDIRERVKEEYRDLVQNLFSAAFTLKTRFDEFRNQLYDDMFNSIGDVRREAVMTMSKLKSKQGGMEEEDALQRNLRKNEELSRITHDNNQLNRLVLKMKMMNNWKRTHLREFYESEVFRLQQEADRCKKESLEIQMMAEEDVILLRQELLAMKKALANSEKARELIQKQQEKESRQKKELEHKVEQAARSAKQLEHARASNLEKLMERLEDKDVRLKTLSSEQEKNMKMNQIMQNKVRKDMGQMKKQLSHERSMKLDAFQRIDELQTQVYDYEVDYQLPSRPHTAGTVRTTRTTKSSRPSTGFWPPAIGFPPNYNRSLTPDPWPKEGDSDRVTQRPKTVNGRLRSQITEQLVHDMEPHQHETIMQLLALEKTKTQKVGQK